MTEFRRPQHQTKDVQRLKSGFNLASWCLVKKPHRMEEPDFTVTDVMRFRSPFFPQTQILPLSTGSAYTRWCARMLRVPFTRFWLLGSLQLFNLSQVMTEYSCYLFAPSTVTLDIPQVISTGECSRPYKSLMGHDEQCQTVISQILSALFSDLPESINVVWIDRRQCWHTTSKENASSVTVPTRPSSNPQPWLTARWRPLHRSSQWVKIKGSGSSINPSGLVAHPWTGVDCSSAKSSLKSRAQPENLNRNCSSSLAELSSSRNHSTLRSVWSETFLTLVVRVCFRSVFSLFLMRTRMNFLHRSKFRSEILHLKSRTVSDMQGKRFVEFTALPLFRKQKLICSHLPASTVCFVSEYLCSQKSKGKNPRCFQCDSSIFWFWLLFLLALALSAEEISTPELVQEHAKSWSFTLHFTSDSEKRNSGVVSRKQGCQLSSKSAVFT